MQSLTTSLAAYSRFIAVSAAYLGIKQRPGTPAHGWRDDLAPAPVERRMHRRVVIDDRRGRPASLAG